MTATASEANTVGRQKPGDAEKIKRPVLINTVPRLAQRCNAQD